MRLTLLGPPGAGKGTQGRRLAFYYGVPHIATGDLVRDQIARRTDFGRKIESAIAAGNFAPDADILQLIRQRLQEPDARAGYVLDGFPRDLAQAEAWAAKAFAASQPLDAAIELVLADDEVVRRLSGRLVCPVDDTVYHVLTQPPRVPGRCDSDGAFLVRRSDDEPDAVRHRLDVYERLTVPLREFYRAQGLLMSVSAVGAVEEITQRILCGLQGLKSATVEV